MHLLDMYFLERPDGAQGQVVLDLGGHLYLARLFSWVDGAPTSFRVVSLKDACDKRWEWFSDHEQWLARCSEIMKAVRQK